MAIFYQAASIKGAIRAFGETGADVVYVAEPFWDNPPGDWYIRVTVFRRPDLSREFPPRFWDPVEDFGSSQCFCRFYPTQEMGGNLSRGMAEKREEKRPAIQKAMEEDLIPRLNAFFLSLSK